MTKRRVHILAFDVPFPADYGGVIDIYFKCRTLTRLGVEVILHCYQYGRPTRPELNEVASEVHYYPRKRTDGLFSLSLPHIVASRKHPELLSRLLQDSAPILYEGLHTTFFLGHPSLEGRRQVVRMHNIEHAYYSELANQESNPMRKMYDRIEAKRLRTYESILEKADHIAAISEGDALELATRYGNKVQEVPGFHPYHEVSGPLGLGAYAFYHGNLSVIENHRAAMWLIKEVFSKLDSPLVIAGRSPSVELFRAARPFPWVRIVADPEQDEMDTLLRDAQVVVLPTFQSTGLKLKLLSSLFKGRHVLATPNMVLGSGLANLCTQSSTPIAYRQEVIRLMGIPYTADIREERKHVLVPRFDNATNGQRLIDILGL